MFRRSTREEDLQRADIIVNGIIDGEIQGKGKKNIELSDLLKELFHLKNLLDDDFQTFVEKLLSNTEGDAKDYVLDYMYSKKKMEYIPLDMLKNMVMQNNECAISYLIKSDISLSFPKDALILAVLWNHGSDSDITSDEWYEYLRDGDFPDKLADIFTDATYVDFNDLDNQLIITGLIEGYEKKKDYEIAFDLWSNIRGLCDCDDYDDLFEKIPSSKTVGYFIDHIDQEDIDDDYFWGALDAVLDDNDKTTVIDNSLVVWSEDIFDHYIENKDSERAWKFYKMIGCDDDAVWEKIINLDASLENRPEPEYNVEKPTKKIDKSPIEPVKPEAKAIPQSIWHQIKVEETPSAEAKTQEKPKADNDQIVKEEVKFAPESSTKAIPKTDYPKVPETKPLPTNTPVPSPQPEPEAAPSSKANETQDAAALYDIYLKKKTIKNLSAAAKAGNPQAMYELGMHYLDLHKKTPMWKKAVKAVKGTKTNKERGEEWIARAAKLGCQDAKRLIK